MYYYTTELLFFVHLLVATAVTLRSVDQPDNPGGQLRVAEQSLRNIQEGRVSPTAVPTQSSSSSGKGWFKKFVEG